MRRPEGHDDLEDKLKTKANEGSGILYPE